MAGYNSAHPPVKVNSTCLSGSNGARSQCRFIEFLQGHGKFAFRLERKYDDEFYKTIPAKLARGEMMYREDITKGLDKVGDVILAVMKETTRGKTVVLVADS